MIHVGRQINGVNPQIPGFEPVVVMMKSSKYYSLSPYSLKNDNGQIMENIWQFSKVYPWIPPSVQRYSRYDNRIIWSHQAEKHVDDNGNLTEEYWNWRSKGFNHPEAVRYPTGYQHRKHCIYSIWIDYNKECTNPNRIEIHENNDKNGLTYHFDKLDYIQSRKTVYLPLYINLVAKQPQFSELLSKLKSGRNLLIIEVDGPHQESLDYYKDTYQVNDYFIENNSMLATEHNLRIMLNDSRHNFGHGYCLAWALFLHIQRK